MSYLAGSVSTAGGSSTSRALTRPPGAAVGHTLWLRLYVEDTTLTPSISPGTWTKDTNASGKQLADATDWEAHVYTCVQGSESGTINIAWGGATVFNDAMAAAYTGRNPSAVLDGTSTFNATGSAGTTVTCNAVTTTVDGADVIASAGAAASATGAYAWTGVTERAEGDVQSFGDTTQATAGTTGNKTATVDSSIWAGSLQALRTATPMTMRQSRPFPYKPGTPPARNAPYR